jgi:hypothetical protein
VRCTRTSAGTRTSSCGFAEWNRGRRLVARLEVALTDEHERQRRADDADRGRDPEDAVEAVDEGRPRPAQPPLWMLRSPKLFDDVPDGFLR